MKIGLDGNFLKPDIGKPSDTSAVNETTGFEKVLNETISGQVAEAAGSLVGGVQSTGISVMFPESSQPLEERVDQMLDSLDSYRRMLGDGNYTLRDMDPTVRKIAAEAGELQKELDDIPVGDELGDILNQTLITASLEVIKFNRGDYITA